MPGNLLYGFAPLQAPGSHGPVNGVAGDVAVQLYPWFSFARGEILAGRLPLWNPYSRGGSPFLANAQSAVLSPFTLLAVPFRAPQGFSLAMLARLWTAGLGAALFLRALRARAVAAILGGLAYGSSAFIVVWMGYPASAVAAFAPFAFAAAEWFLGRAGGPRALAALAVSTALMLVAGHPETTLQLGLPLALYAGARWLATGRSPRVLVALGMAAVLGFMLSAVVFLPFLQEASADRLVGDRLALGYGGHHLQLGDLASWLAPNRYGNPGIDGRGGPPPNYAEATGFAGVWTLVFAGAGAFASWRRDRALASALVGLLLLTLGIAYGPLSGVAGAIPVLGATGNGRFVGAAGLFLAVLAGLGVEDLLARGARGARRRGAAAVIAAAVAAPVALAAVFSVRGAAVDSFGRVGPWLSFWVAFAAACLVAAILLVLAARTLPGPAMAALAALALVEAAVFVGPYNSRALPGDIPPPSAFLARAAAVAGDTPTALELVIPPETGMLYGLRDENGYDALTSPRARDFWRASNPDYAYTNYHLMIGFPPVAWLRAAGVGHLVGPQGLTAPGLEPQFSGGPAELYAVAGAHGLAFIPRTVVAASGERQALEAIPGLPGDGVALEQADGRAVAAPGAATVLAYRPGALDVAVSGSSTTTLVVSEGYDPGWRARVDGREIPVVPANVVLLGMRVPGSGVRVVHLRYEPPEVTAGAVASIIGLVGIVVILASSYRRRPSRRRAPAG